MNVADPPGGTMTDPMKKSHGWFVLRSGATEQVPTKRTKGLAVTWLKLITPPCASVMVTYVNGCTGCTEPIGALKYARTRISEMSRGSTELLVTRISGRNTLDVHALGTS